MSQPTPASCPHEHRQITTVCLHCRHAARVAARAERTRLMARVALTTILLAVLVAAGRAGATALQEMRLGSERPVAMAVSVPRRDAPPAAERARRAEPVPAPDQPARPVAQPAAPAETPTSRRPVVGEGRTELPDESFAIRTADTVTVHFDTELGRTRRPEKLERVIRATLPKIYGAMVDSLLATIAEGGLVRGGDLLTELPVRGLRFPLTGGGTLALWPETRPGRDGPIVVSYRVTLER